MTARLIAVCQRCGTRPPTVFDAKLVEILCDACVCQGCPGPGNADTCSYCSRFVTKIHIAPWSRIDPPAPAPERTS